MPKKRKPTTIRLEPNVQEGLELLAKVLKVPLNRLVNEAVQALVRKRATEVVVNMEVTLKLLKEKIANDPGFEQAINEFAKNEVLYAKDDPAEGDIKDNRGPMQTKVYEMLNG